MSRKRQQTIGPNADIPATTEFNASSLSMQQVSVPREQIQFSLRNADATSSGLLSGWLRMLREFR
jgi:hypothetical protein